MASLQINPTGLNKLYKRYGITTDAEFAYFIEINQSNVSRVFSGKAQPSARFIAGVAKAFGYKVFPSIFTLEED